MCHSTHWVWFVHVCTVLTARNAPRFEVWLSLVTCIASKKREIYLNECLFKLREKGGLHLAEMDPFFTRHHRSRPWKNLNTFGNGFIQLFSYTWSVQRTTEIGRACGRQVYLDQNDSKWIVNLYLRNFEASSKRFLRFWHLAAVFTPSDVSWGNRWSAPSRRSCNANPGRLGRQRHTWSYLRYLEITKDYLCCLGEFTWGWFFDKNSFLRPTHIEAYPAGRTSASGQCQEASAAEHLRVGGDGSEHEGRKKERMGLL